VGGELKCSLVMAISEMDLVIRSLREECEVGLIPESFGAPKLEDSRWTDSENQQQRVSSGGFRHAPGICCLMEGIASRYYTRRQVGVTSPRAGSRDETSALPFSSFPSAPPEANVNI
jgi:hypothetical protein